jgi:hypothetical protein
MTFTFEDYHYEIQFKYTHHTGLRGIDCYINQVHGQIKKRVAIGWSSCSSADVFVKETGRKIALTRALGEIVYALPVREKAFRTAAWTAYHNRKALAVVKEPETVDAS